MCLNKKTTTANVSNDAVFQVKFLEGMNVRTAAGTSNKIVDACKTNYVHTIVETTKVGTTLWGRLKSGAGWVCIDNKYCTRV